MTLGSNEAHTSLRRRRVLRQAAAAALTLSGSLAWRSARGAIFTVGPELTLANALKRAADGDEIQLPSGDYRGQVGVINQKRLTLRGLGARPVLHAAGQSAEGKAILVVRQGDVRIENIEFRGARVADRNGAGIRFEKGRLHVQGCGFFDNENGLLTANFGDAELNIHDSEFGQAPAGTPLPHLVYVGRIARFTLRGCRVSGGDRGHLVKSRAMESFIQYNELVDGAGGRAAYELEFPNGGSAWVVGNVIGQSANTSNPALVSLGAEGADDRPRRHALVMAHNTFINDANKPALFVHVHELKPQEPTPVRLFNNLFVGMGASNAGWGDVTQGNVPVPRSALVDPDVRAYGLKRGSWLRGRAVEMPDVLGQSIKPTAQFVAPARTRELSPSQALNAGAVQD